jgi:hypothetical protein
MRNVLFLTAAGAAAVVPAVIGLSGNPALSHQVPVRVPANVVPVSSQDLARVDDHPAGDDHRAVPTSSARTTEPGDDHGGTRTTTRTPAHSTEPGDDHAGTRTRTTTRTPAHSTEPGDDRGGTRRGNDDHAGDDDAASNHTGDDHVGDDHAGDDHAGDDHGRQRHGGGDDSR